MKATIPKKAVLSKEEIARLIQAAESVRNKLIIAMLYHAGIRTAELASLKLSDVDRGKGLMKVVGFKIRLVRYSEEYLGALVDSWLRERKNCANAKHVDYFFVSETGKKLSLKEIHRVVRKAAWRAAIHEVRGNTADGRPIYEFAPLIIRHVFARSSHFWGAQEDFKGASARRTRRPRPKVRKAKRGEKA